MLQLTWLRKYVGRGRVKTGSNDRRVEMYRFKCSLSTSSSPSSAWTCPGVYTNRLFKKTNIFSWSLVSWSLSRIGWETYSISSPVSVGGKMSLIVSQMRMKRPHTLSKIILKDNEKKRLTKGLLQIKLRFHTQIDKSIGMLGRWPRVFSSLRRKR